MPTLDKIPKNAIFLTAKDLDDFLKWQDIWTKNGWLIAADYNQGFYSAIALKDTNVLCLGYRDPSYVEVEPQVEPTTLNDAQQVDPATTPSIDEEIQEGEAAEAAAIESLEKI